MNFYGGKNIKILAGFQIQPIKVMKNLSFVTSVRFLLLYPHQFLFQDIDAVHYRILECPRVPLNHDIIAGNLHLHLHILVLMLREQCVL